MPCEVTANCYAAIDVHWIMLLPSFNCGDCNGARMEAKKDNVSRFAVRVSHLALRVSRFVFLLSGQYYRLKYRHIAQLHV